MITCKALPLTLKIAMRNYALKIMMKKGTIDGVNDFIKAEKLIRMIKLQLKPLKTYKRRFTMLTKKEQSESEREQYKPLKLFGLGTEVLPPKKIPIRNRSPMKAAAKASPSKVDEGVESDREYDQFL